MLVNHVLASHAPRLLPPPPLLTSPPTPLPQAQGATTTTFKFALHRQQPAFEDDLEDWDGTDCSGMEVDQLLLYVNPAVLDYVTEVWVGGRRADFARRTGRMHSWVQVVNLYHDDDLDALVEVVVSGKLGAKQLCSATADKLPLCQYVLKGQYVSRTGQYQCCPRGAAVVQHSPGVCRPRVVGSPGSRRRLQAARSAAPSSSVLQMTSARRPARPSSSSSSV
jgi:hypothetical protein